MSEVFLKDNQFQRRIRDMKVGEFGWTVPHALSTAKGFPVKINGNYTLQPERGGTVQLFITRDHDGFSCVNYGDEPYQDCGATFGLPVISLERK